jgi:lysyl-tRNA synthetase class 1
VGSQLVRDVFGGQPPVYVGNSFVGTSGTAKMSGSAGLAPTPGDALDVLEPPLLRWLYARRKPNQSFTVSFGQELVRLYDEWDALERRAAAGTEPAPTTATWTRSRSTATRVLPATERPRPFRTLASVVDLVAGDEQQMLRVFRELTATDPVTDLDQLRPRLDRATTWIQRYVPPAERTRVRTEPDTARLVALSDSERQAVEMLAADLADHWSPDQLTTLVYGIPKRQHGLPLDTPPTEELKAGQRAFFALLYQLLVGRDTGPRLPTLLLSLGQERIRYLLKA